MYQPHQNQVSQINETLERRVAIFRESYPWAVNFERQMIVEILFAIDYDTNYEHGTSGHLAYQTIAELMNVLTFYVHK